MLIEFVGGPADGRWAEVDPRDVRHEIQVAFDSHGDPKVMGTWAARNLSAGTAWSAYRRETLEGTLPVIYYAVAPPSGASGC